MSEMLPNEPHESRRIENDLSGILGEAKRLLNVGTDAIHRPARIRVGPRQQYVARLLLANGCRHFRSIIAVVEVGDGPAVEILTRTMFELFVAIKFVLLPRVRLWTEDFNTGVRRKIPVKRHGKRLTPEFRATLYIAISPFRQRVGQ